MDEHGSKPVEGKRVGLHPALVLFGVIVGLWLFITLIIPKSKNTDTPQSRGMPPESPTTLPSTSFSSDVVPIFKTKTTIPEMNIINLTVPPATTDSQIVALLHHLKDARINNTLANVLPPTTPGDDLGEFAIAEIYIFSEPEYAVPEATEVLSRGAHAPGTLYPSSIPFEVAMEHVRGHYSINLHNRTTPETGTLGFGEDETGVYSKQFQKIF
ncbi:MAG: hypothetical protein NPIRA02_36450 [Nitrospirales bacterium]|nr:MAG: hypothetical protein NPIRA02_36450 [Nitrospirales bacterium]